MNNTKMKRLTKMWDGLAIKYDERSIVNESMYASTIKNTLKHLKPNDTVFEFACGTGTITNEIAGSVKEIHAIDISPEMIRAAKRKAVEGNIENIQFAQTTIFDKQYKKESFDAIMGFNILHLYEDRQKSMQRVYELLKPGGIFISTTPCMAEKGVFMKVFMPPFVKLLTLGKLYVKMFKYTELEELIMSEGFQILETETISRDPHYFIAARKK